jgi:HEAT repeat protein
LGPIRSEAVVELLLGLREDENGLVSFSAWSGLAQQNEEPFRRDFVAYYADPKASMAQRAEIVRVIVTRTVAADIATLGLAVGDEETTPRVRRFVSIILGQMGTLESIDALERSVELESGADYRDLAESAIALIRERNGV